MNVLWKCAKNYANWCRSVKEIGIRMQWPRLILLVKNQVVEFIAGWHNLFYKFIQYKFNTCVQKTQRLSIQTITNCFRNFEDVVSQI